jgi:cytochrome c oxidase subunit 2
LIKKNSNEIGTSNHYININKTEILFKEETPALSSDLVENTKNKITNIWEWKNKIENENKIINIPEWENKIENDNKITDILEWYNNININEKKGGTTNIEYDTPEPWGVFFQDNATPQMEGLEELHNNIMFYLAIILFSVTWILVSIVLNYSKSYISNKYLNHGTLVELIWTITPALILIFIAFPSFKLLYLMDEVIDPSLVIYGEGHQWYWSYQYPDFTNNDEEYVEYDSYIIPESDLEKGQLRMLEVDNRVIIPELTHTRFVVGGADVIHSYACPSLGIKCDAYPGRLNQSSVYLNREGTYYGQCSEICGILHSSMPISIQSVNLGKFLFWLYDQIGS